MRDGNSETSVRNLRIRGGRAGKLTAAVVLGAGIIMGVAPARAAGDAPAGKKLYDKSCRGCHGDAKTQGTAPTLVGIVGRQAGTSSTGATSRALSESGIVWDEASMQAYLASPGDKVHGTIMPIGVQRAADRDDLIAYLKSLR